MLCIKFWSVHAHVVVSLSQVKRDFMCLYCNERCHPFTSLEAVRKHMAAKGHCKVHYGDDDEDEEVELEEFYDYSSRYASSSIIILSYFIFLCVNLYLFIIISLKTATWMKVGSSWLQLVIWATL